MVPRISRVGVLWDANERSASIGFKEYEAAARALKIQLQSLEVRGPNPDIEGAFQAAAKGRVNALIPIKNSRADEKLDRKPAGPTDAGLEFSSRLSAQCRVCGTLLSGAMSVVFRTVGIKRSSRNPNICTRCSTHIDEGRLAEITVLFADLSSFTELTHDLGAEKTHEVIDAFLRMATDALVNMAPLSTSTSATP